VGLLITTVGFVVAIKQLKDGKELLGRTATAAEATKAAIESANTRMVYNHLLVLLPQLTGLEADIDAAMATDDRQAAVRALVKFNHTANQIAMLLNGEAEFLDDGLVEDLRSTARSATQQKSALVSGSKKSVGSHLQAVAIEIAGVAARCSALATTYQTKAA
jgi:hypothetical protein